MKTKIYINIKEYLHADEKEPEERVGSVDVQSNMPLTEAEIGTLVADLLHVGEKELRTNKPQS
ncbi:hypothetical protein LCGC14_1302790 [marine sediment metagenome]|uniref:Uncharacterized protein n=1 Tax=marine sediment metagenome TaxID=412755 RepID=A0A0F9L9P8_9ZZZZ